MASARKREADLATRQAQRALTAVGMKAAADTLILWQDTTPGNVSTTWVETITKLVTGSNGVARTIAWAHYRLIRALFTGSTIRIPGEEKKPSVQLSELREDFEEAVAPWVAVERRLPDASPGRQPDPEKVSRETPDLPVQPATTPTPSRPTPLPVREAQTSKPSPESNSTPVAVQEKPVPEEPYSASDYEDDDDRILMEEIARLEEEERRIDAALDQEAQNVIRAFAQESEAKRIAELNPRQPAKDYNAKADEIHAQAGARTAAAVDRMVKNGGRSRTFMLTTGDAGALGWMRISRTGTPCGFCAMLISRGFTPKKDGGLKVGALFSSKASATVKGGGDRNSSDTYDDGDLYHDNCNCTVVPVFDKAWAMDSPLLDLNREYAKLWPIVTEGLGGKSAMTAWRRYFREKQKAAQAA